MSPWLRHLPVVPIVLPLLAAATILLLTERARLLRVTVACASILGQLAASVMLLALTTEAFPDIWPQGVGAYAIGAWPAPFGIVLAIDRLTGLMLVLTSVIGLAACVNSLAWWDRVGPHFHTLLQLLLMGVNGAFLTGDLFNLFVFFEVFLAASYGLALHGSGAARVQASLHYIVVNLTASFLFLIGAALVYGVTGTLNLADLGARIPGVAAADRSLLEAGAAILAVAFLIKAGMWPLCFWLPRSYGAACAPAAALFAILTKVGIYAVLRVGLLFFGEGSGESAGFGRDWLMAGGLLTLAFGAIGVFGAQELSRLAGFSLVASCGTLLAAVGAGQAAVSGAALYYLVASTLGVSALFLLIELVERGRAPGADMLAITAEAFGGFEAGEREEIGVAIPATWAVLGLSFVACALLLAGLPPLPGFVAKLALLDALLRPESVGLPAWMLLALLMFSGFATVVAASRTGARIFWVPERRMSARVSVIEILPVLLLLGVGVALAVEAGAAMRYLDAAAQALHAPRGYIDGVLR